MGPSCCEERDRKTGSSGEEDDEQVKVHPAIARKKAKQKASFFRMCRKLMAFAATAIVLSNQPFVVKPRQSGSNRIKLVPLQLSICAAVHWAKDSPTVLRKPKLAQYINTTAQVLLTPYEYGRAQQSKRAMPNEKTLKSAFNKAKRLLSRIADSDLSLRQLLAMPSPNIPVIGAAAIVAGSFLSIFGPGAEYVTVIGCGMLVHGCKSLGMQAQPELYVTGALAVLAIMLMDGGNPPPPDKVSKKKRR